MREGRYTLVKVLIVGESDTGKTSLVRRFVEEEFSADYLTTLGVDFSVKTIPLEDGNNIKLQLWDTAGQERFKGIVQQYFRGAQGAIITFQRTKPSSFKAIPQFVEQCRLYNKNLPIIVAETKIDSLGGLAYNEATCVSDNEIIQLCSTYRCAFVRSSAMTGENVEIVFRTLCEQIITRLQNENPLVSPTNLLKIQDQTYSSPCCTIL